MNPKARPVADTRRWSVSPETLGGLSLLGCGLLGYLTGVLLAFVTWAQASEHPWSVLTALQSERGTFEALGCFGAAAGLTAGLVWTSLQDRPAPLPASPPGRRR